jgi:hypothetical protein
MVKQKNIELDKRQVELDLAKRGLEQATARLKALQEASTLAVTVAVNRATGMVSIAANIADADDVDRAIGGLEMAVANLRREQLRLAEERGKAAAAPQAAPG